MIHRRINFKARVLSALKENAFEERVKREEERFRQEQIRERFNLERATLCWRVKLETRAFLTWKENVREVIEERE